MHPNTAGSARLQVADGTRLRTAGGGLPELMPGEYGRGRHDRCP